MTKEIASHLTIPDRRVPDIFKDVRTFLQLAQPEMMHELGQPIKAHVAKLAWKLIDEEVNTELKPDLEKLANGDFSLELLSRVLDHYLDTIYVAVWAIEAFGLPGHAGWNEVQRANLNKFPLIADWIELDGETIPCNPQDSNIKCTVTPSKIFPERFALINDETGKVVKPEGFTPPDIWNVVYTTMMMKKLRTMPDVMATPFMKDYFHEMEKRQEEGKL